MILVTSREVSGMQGADATPPGRRAIIHMVASDEYPQPPIDSERNPADSPFKGLVHPHTLAEATAKQLNNHGKPERSLFFTPARYPGHPYLLQTDIMRVFNQYSSHRGEGFILAMATKIESAIKIFQMAAGNDKSLTVGQILQAAEEMYLIPFLEEKCPEVTGSPEFQAINVLAAQINSFQEQTMLEVYRRMYPYDPDWLASYTADGPQHSAEDARKEEEMEDDSGGQV
ncbi:MAG: hypothetical protein LBJ77_03740 [Holosporales bacterium]|nr:hypothetical protein [Holosporales bacterium]